MDIEVDGVPSAPLSTGSPPDASSVPINGTDALPMEDEIDTLEIDIGSEQEDEVRDDKSCFSTGYVYDTRMLAHFPVIASGDMEYPHPEQPPRISRIHSTLRSAECLKKMRKLPIRPLEKYEALLVHSEDHWDKVEAIAFMNDEDIQNSEEYYERLSLYVHRDTPVVAKLSGGGVIETCLAVARGEVANAFAIVRPPGHHAEPEEHMGFCFFNNVAIAARVVQEVTPLKRIMILDWDVHHGNGTQRAFWTDDTVLYISLHRYEQGTFYPSGPYGSMESCGEGPGLGKSVNIPWPIKGMGDADYLYAFQKMVLPIAYEFAPELVIISAGFDAADGDDLGECHVTPAGYAHMTHMLRSLANGKLVAVLEGGYNLESTSSSALAVTKILLGAAPPDLPPMLASEAATETVWQVSMQQSKYWKSIHPKALEPREELQAHTPSILEILKLYRANYLFQTHKMFQIPFVDDRLAARFDGQMVCTENVYIGTGTLVVFMHDLCNLRIELDGKEFCNVKQEKSYLEDATDQIVKWITTDKDYSYIDLNLFPSLVAQSKLHHSPQKSCDQDIQDLVLYIWDNYIEYVWSLLEVPPPEMLQWRTRLSEAAQVVMICHGSGSQAAMNLIRSRDVMRKVQGIIHIVSNGVPPRVPPDELRAWYRERSLVIASSKSRIFEIPDKVKMRYGNVLPQAAETSVGLLSGSLDEIKSFVSKCGART